MVIKDKSKSVLKTHRRITYRPLKLCRRGMNSRRSHEFLISHKAQQNYQSESKFNSVAVIMKGQISPSIDFSASSSPPSSTSVWLSCFHILIMCWIIDQPHAALQLQSTHTHTPSFFYCCGDFRYCRCAFSFDLKNAKICVGGDLQGVRCSTIWEQRQKVHGHPTCYTETLGHLREVGQKNAALLWWQIEKISDK